MDKSQPNRFERRKRRTRRQLQDAALDLLLEKGYPDLTIQDITDRADFARGTFYVHFDDKDDIIRAILQDSMDDLVQDTLTAMVNVPYRRRKVMLWVRLFEYTHANRDVLRVLFGERGHPAFVRWLGDFIAEVLHKGIDAGTFQPDVPDGVPLDFTVQFMTGAMVRMMAWSVDTDHTPEDLAVMFYTVVYREAPPDFP